MSYAETLWNILSDQGLEGLHVDTLIKVHPQDAAHIYQTLFEPKDMLIYLWEDVRSQVEARVDQSLEGTERLFDVLMHYFDVLQPYQQILRQVETSLVTSPCILVRLHDFALHWAKDMLMTSNLMEDNLFGLAQSYTFLGFCGWLMARWLRDESPDLSRTMMDLDQGLEKMQNVWNFLPRF